MLGTLPCRLWQGISTNTVIVLERETHAGISIMRRSKASIVTIQQNAKPGGFDTERKARAQPASATLALTASRRPLPALRRRPTRTARHALFSSI